VLASLLQLPFARECPTRPWWAMGVVVAQKVPARTGSHGGRVPACASVNEEVTFPAASQTGFYFAMAIPTPTGTIPQPSVEVAVVEAVVRLIGAMYLPRPYATSAAAVRHRYLASWRSQEHCAAGVGSAAGTSMADAFATRATNCPRTHCRRRRCLADRWNPSAVLDDSCWMRAQANLATLEAEAENPEVWAKQQKCGGVTFWRVKGCASREAGAE
jgi:hypothetical protein